MPTFASSKQSSGTETAGTASCLFCIPTYRINGIATPCRVSGNRLGVSAILSLTARSVVFLCQNQNRYETEDLFLRVRVLAADGRHTLHPHIPPQGGVHSRQTDHKNCDRVSDQDPCRPFRLVAFRVRVDDRPLRHRRRGGVHPWRRGEGSRVPGRPGVADGVSGIENV